MIEEVSVEDGKYTFQYNTETCELTCLRNKLPWREFPIGDKAMYALFYEAREAKFKVVELEKELKALRVDAKLQRDREEFSHGRPFSES